MKVRKGDTIRVMAGKDKGRQGKVEKVYTKQNKLLVPGINIYKKHVKKNEQMPQGGVVEVPRPINSAKVSLICPKCKKATRIGFLVEKGRKVRICRKCKAEI